MSRAKIQKVSPVVFLVGDTPSPVYTMAAAYSVASTVVASVLLLTLLLQCGAVKEKDGVTAKGIWSRIQLGAANAAGGLSRLFSAPKPEEEENAHCRTEEEDCHELSTKDANEGAVTKTKPSIVSYFPDPFEWMKRKVTTSASELFDSVRMAVRSVLYEELGKIFTPDLSTPG